MSEYVPPAQGEKSFNCPHCQAFTRQYWRDLTTETLTVGRSQVKGSNRAKNVNRALCEKCDKYSIWVDGQMVFPKPTEAPVAHKDMPDSANELFEEARQVFTDSPRAAGPLLRICLENLLEELEAEGDTNFKKIGNLVENGLDKDVQKAMDSVRLIGNGHSHSGEFFLQDDKNAILTMFKLLNIVVQQEITSKKNIEDVWKEVPESKKKGIEDRDSND